MTERKLPRYVNVSVPVLQEHSNCVLRNKWHEYMSRIERPTVLNRTYVSHNRANAILTMKFLELLLVVEYGIFGLGLCGLPRLAAPN